MLRGFFLYWKSLKYMIFIFACQEAYTVEGQYWRLVLFRAPLTRRWVFCNMAQDEHFLPCPFLAHTPTPSPHPLPRSDSGRDPQTMSCFGFLPCRQTQHWREGRGAARQSCLLQGNMQAEAAGLWASRCASCRQFVGAEYCWNCPHSCRYLARGVINHLALGCLSGLGA